MRVRCAALLVLLAFPALGGLPLQRFDAVMTTQVEFPAGGTVHITGSTGDLSIEGWDQLRVEVTVIKSVWSNHSEEAGRLLDRAQVAKPAVSGNELTIASSHKRLSGIQVSYRIRVPRDAHMVIRHDTGTIILFDVSGDVDASAKIGDILLQVRGDQYRIQARNDTGGEVYSDYSGKMHYTRLVLGESLTTDAEGNARHLRLRVRTGGITIQKMS